MDNATDDDDAFDQNMRAQCLALFRWFSHHQDMTLEQVLATLTVGIGANIGGKASSIEHLKEDLCDRFNLIEECADDVFYERLHPGRGEIESISRPSDQQEEQVVALIDWFVSQDIDIDEGHMAMAVLAGDLIGFDAPSRDRLEKLIRTFRDEVEGVARIVFEGGREDEVA